MTSNGTYLIQQIAAEQKKARHRHVLIFPAGVLLILFLWSLWGNKTATPSQLAQGYTSLLYQLPMMNAIFMPVMLAVIASRLCDMEIKGATLKLLFTLQRRSSFYNCKLLYGIKYLFIFTLGEILLILGCGQIFHFTEPLRPGLILLNFISTLLVGTVVLIVQQTLSLLSENQLMPLIVGLCGSFLGLFSMYFPRAVSRFVLWGYFGMFTPLGMDWDPKTRIITYFDIPFPTTDFIIFLIAGIIIYLAGITLFLRKDV
ncbi:ABC transporter permease [Ruminococcus sp. OA3]|uniref:ABC transporter permease n=1 Tax=Ruminococcus sp. OA3 TaxID=2914164 RepID=UPI001F06D350|nr:ABC transporter permease [Ruminococcus sp. OA3]MCH1984403.1 ABC transporter permease [Ruminococcus sp. OA3]